MRMLFIPNETFPTSRVDVEVLFGRELHGRGHQIDFVMQAASAGVVADSEPWRGRSVLIGPTDTGGGLLHSLRRHWLSLLHDLRYLGRLDRSRYDVVQVRDKFLVAALAVVIARLRGVPFCFWLSFPKPEMEMLRAAQGTARYPLLARLRGWLSGLLLYGWILPRSDHVFVQSALMKRNVCAHGIDPAKVTPVPMGVDFADLARSRGPLPRRGDTGVVLVYLGVIANERRLEILIDMLGELRAGGMNASLSLVGDARDPRERKALEDRAELLGVRNHLRVTGFLPRGQALELAGAADVCLSPIYPSPIYLVASPTKLVEYLALGVPVVANDHPEQRLVLRESGGGVCAPWGARHFARAVRWIMRHPSAERVAMGQRGREWVEAHRTYRRIADDIERVYLVTMARQARAQVPEQAGGG